MTFDKTRHRIPEKLIAVLGQEATDELIEWMDERLTAMLRGGVEQIRLSPFTARQKVNVLRNRKSYGNRH